VFTGLVEAVGTVASVREMASARRVVIHAPGLAGELEPGESVAVDGACLTAVEMASETFAVEVVATTLSRTIAGRYREGSRVNLERALRLGERVGGHWVQGHVDGLGTLRSVERDGDYRLLDFELPSEVEARTILHGSVAIQGVSLTVNRLGEGGCQVAVIPHTWERTNLSGLVPGDAVNVEGDMIGKYVERVLGPWRGREPVRPEAS
jgi:riboflavin synthase